MDRRMLTASIRETKGKGAARRLRNKNKVPAIFYGPETEPIMLALDYQGLTSLLEKGAGKNAVINLQVQSDRGIDSRKVILKDLMVDSTTDTYLHADFYEISMDKEITVEIPVRLLNTPIGVEQEGILQHIKRELTISCLPDKLVDAIEFDVSGLDIGDSLHVSDIALPEGIKTLDEGHLTVAVIAAPTVIAEETEEEEEMEAEETTVESKDEAEES